MDLPLQGVSQDVLNTKYMKAGETELAQIHDRIARSLAAVESDPAKWQPLFQRALDQGFVPAGRVVSAAGTDLQTTLINCFVQPVGDCMRGVDDDGYPGITDALAEAAETMRRGGGVGYDFSRIRPRNAVVRKTRSTASGPISYMRMFDSMCKTVESAGARRGAQMGILRCDHPDIEQFVVAKSQQGELTQFNISVGVTDPFMEAVEQDRDWPLVHKAEPSDELQAEGAYQLDDGRWVYRTIRARDLWDTIMEQTYDYAEPGVIFLDRVNADNNLWYAETIEAVNPCVTGDTWVHTAEGPRQVHELTGRPVDLLVNGARQRSTEAGFFVTGNKPVLRLMTREGQSLRLTTDHPVLRRVEPAARDALPRTEWVPAGELQAGDRVVLHDHGADVAWAGDSNADEGYLIGLLLGDGTLKTQTATLSVWDAAIAPAADGTVPGNPVMRAAETAARSLPHRSDFGGWHAIEDRNEFRLNSTGLRDLAGRFGMTPGNKTVTPAIERASSDFYTGFLRGLFDADGSVQGTQAKGVSVRLAQSDLATLEAVQRMLGRLGIGSTIYRERRPARRAELPHDDMGGKGGSAEYDCRAQHELVISGGHLPRFAERVGFNDTARAERLRRALGNYRRAINRPRWYATVDRLEPDGSETVYDVQVPNVHAFDANGLYVHNCGEQMLPPYGCCDLGSPDLTRFVRDPFTPEARFDFEAFREVVGIATRMLDNVLDATYWPLEQQREEAMNKRRIGLGFLGLGDTLIMLGLPYNTQAARDQAEQIIAAERDAAYWTSVELAREKGAFPLFDADKYLASAFTQRLPADLRKAIAEHGIRNSHLLSIAPTGTISLALADNASNGIEPPFALAYNRRVRQHDDTHRDYLVEDHALRVFRHVKGIADPRPGEAIGDWLTALRPQLGPEWVTALEMSAADHQKMVSVIAPYVDSAISKTVNVPAEYPYAEFKQLYTEAWKHNAKGLATYRPSDVRGAVLSTHDSKTEQVSDLDESDPDRRLRLEEVPEPPLASLRWHKRPRPAAGNMAWTYLIDHPQGNSFAVFIGQLPGGRQPGADDREQPFEVWVNGAEQPRGLGALAKSLSMDMRSADRAWLKAKLESLGKLAADDAFDMPMPPDGEHVRMPSLVAAFARLIRYRCEALGALDDNGDTPVLNALMSAKEPKTGTDGTMSWTVDINNPATGDDFMLGVKELVLPDGQRRPYSLWLSGVYPRAFDGLAKSLSFDMRIIDPAWAGAKLRQLLSYAEPQGDFLAWVPGADRQASYPSTVAYIARLVIHRYAMLGILDEEGYPMDAMGVLAYSQDHDNVVPLRHAGAQEVMPGRGCPECGNYAVIKKDGCDFCTACGATGGCG